MIEKMIVKKRTIRERTPARRGVSHPQPQVDQSMAGSQQTLAGDTQAAQPAGTARPQAN